MEPFAPRLRHWVKLQPFVSMVPVDAPNSRASKHEVKKHKAVEDGRVAPIIHREEPLWGMADEIGHRHLTGQNEGHRSGVQADEDHDSSHDLQNACETKKRKHRRLR